MVESTVRDRRAAVRFCPSRQILFKNKYMDINDKKIEEIRKAEMVISKNLFLVTVIVTLVAMLLMTVNFFSRGSFFPTQIGFFYLSVVLIYSLHKEFIRWLGEKKKHRQGEYFVYAWIILTTILYMVNFFSHDYYSYSKQGFPLSTLADIAYTTIEVLGIFVITRIMKTFFKIKK